jgi:hypothetical protein
LLPLIHDVLVALEAAADVSAVIGHALFVGHADNARNIDLVLALRYLMVLLPGEKVVTLVSPVLHV